MLVHEIGHLPFEAEITSYVEFGKLNRITVACDNMLFKDTIPQGTVSEQTKYVFFVFFNLHALDLLNCTKFNTLLSSFLLYAHLLS